MSRDMDRIDVQEHVSRRKFVRIVGRNPLQGETNVTFYVPPSEVAEAFGPAQIVGNKILFWNFATRDGKPAFSLFTKPNRKTVELVARDRFSPAYLWTSDRLGSIEIGEETPVALSRAR
jgi:hypothetical protein